MTQYEYTNKAYEIIMNDFTDKRLEYINSCEGLSGQLYCSIVSWVSSYLKGHKWYNSWIDEISDDEIHRELLKYEDALYTVIKAETGITLSKKTCEKVIKYLNENKNKIIIYNVEE